MRNQIILVIAVAALTWSANAQTCKISRSAPLYKQCDAAWGGNKLGSTSTICKVGCAMCSVASGLASLGKTINGQTSTCATLNSYLLNNGGYQGNLLIWSVVNRLGVVYEGQQSSVSAIKDAVCQNKIVILNVNQGGHWVLATGVEGSTFYVNDSGYARTTYPANEVVRASIYRF